MMEGNQWPQVTLGEVSTKIGSGATPRGGKESYKSLGISLIRSLNVYDFKFETTGLAFIDDTQANSLSNVVVEQNDILLNITGASVARCCIVPKKILPARVNQHVSIIRVNPKLANAHYILNVINSRMYKTQLLTIAQGGATREALTKEKIENFEVPLPPLPTQRKIAAILSAYDDLIENNTRRILILEEMAQSLYRHWFVDYKFPGHENVRLVDSGTELGLVPEGWEVVPFTHFVDVLSGGTPKTSVPEYWGGDIPWFTPQDFTNHFYVLDTSRKITELGLSKCNSKLYPRNTVFITARGTVGKCALAARSMAMSQTNYALLTNNGYSQYFLYLLTLNCVRRLKQQATGAVFDTIIVDTFRKLCVEMPNSGIVASFHNLISPIFTLIENIQKKNINLQKARNLLLPKLVSGELDVSELEIDISG